MAKSRLNRKQAERINRKAEYAVAMEQAARVRLLVESLPHQSALDTFLLQESDPIRRKQLFDYCKPWIKFANPQFPSELTQGSRLILP